MTLQKIKFEQVPWINNGKLYRGTFQSNLELKLLKSIAQGQTPSYFGYTDSSEGIITSCSIQPFDAAIYACSRDPDRNNMSSSKPDNRSWPFTRYPSVIEINAENYGNQLCSGLEWPNEVVIRGPIDFKDITILFSTAHDLPQKEDHESQAMQIELEKAISAKKFSKDHSLLKYLREETDAVFAAIYTYGFGMKCSQTEEELQRIQDFVRLMEQTFK
ncbi:hypothetical protein HZA97_06160 [Candidatus Woesearchaeota archaeon]|nr:hypothetical protein [Candidatus Woesearchaeota archaeon]